MVSYIYNTSGVKFARDLFSEHHVSYQAEKAQKWGESPTRAIGFLDDAHFLKLVNIAIAEHGVEAAQRAPQAQVPCEVCGKVRCNPGEDGGDYCGCGHIICVRCALSKPTRRGHTLEDHRS